MPMSGSNQLAAAVVCGVLVSCLPRADLDSYSTEEAAAEIPTTEAAVAEEPASNAASPAATIEVQLGAEGESTPLGIGSNTAGASEFTADARASRVSANSLDAGVAASATDAGAPQCGAGADVAGDGVCWFIGKQELSFSDARLGCRARGAGWDLAAPKTARLNAQLTRLLDAEAWIGGSDQAVEGTWVWLVDGTRFWKGDGSTGAAANGAFTNWASGGEPNGGQASDCARILPANGAWADLQCDQLRVAACQGPAN
jgi:hypothetical protein